VNKEAAVLKEVNNYLRLKLEELFSVGRYETSEYTLTSKASRSIEKLCLLLEKDGNEQVAP
jgi:ABC-type enterochelin transport system ATPase subunit